MLLFAFSFPPFLFSNFFTMQISVCVLLLETDHGYISVKLL